MRRTRLSAFAPAFVLIFALLCLVLRWAYQIRVDYALCAVASEGDVLQVQSFLEKGANVNTQRCGLTPLMGAASEHQTEVVKLLLKSGATVDRKQDPGGSTALMLALVMSRYRPRAALETVRVLLASGADLNAQNDYGMSPIMWARRQKEVLRTKPEAVHQIVQELARPGAVIMRPETGLTPELYATSVRALCDELVQRSRSTRGASRQEPSIETL